MWITVWYGDEFQSIGSDCYISMDTPFCDLTTLFEGAIRVTLSGDEMESRND